jgi:hypothetical protein
MQFDFSSLEGIQLLVAKDNVALSGGKWLI